MIQALGPVFRVQTIDIAMLQPLRESQTENGLSVHAECFQCTMRAGSALRVWMVVHHQLMTFVQISRPE